MYWENWEPNIHVLILIQREVFYSKKEMHKNTEH